MSNQKTFEDAPYGPLGIVAIEAAGRPGYWKFRCPLCGEPFEARVNNVSSGCTTSCGCRRRGPKPDDSVIGQVVGVFTVLEFLGDSLFSVKCRCGKIVRLRRDKLKTQTVCGRHCAWEAQEKKREDDNVRNFEMARRIKAQRIAGEGYGSSRTGYADGRSDDCGYYWKAGARFTLVRCEWGLPIEWQPA